METESWIRPFVSFLGFISQPVCRLLTTRLENQRWEQVEICSPPSQICCCKKLVKSHTGGLRLFPNCPVAPTVGKNPSLVPTQTAPADRPLPEPLARPRRPRQPCLPPPQSWILFLKGISWLICAAKTPRCQLLGSAKGVQIPVEQRRAG